MNNNRCTPNTSNAITRNSCAAVCAFLFYATNVSGATFNVPGDFATIQAAIDAAAPGDAILVGPGSYPENIKFWGKSISLQSTDGSASTTIAPDGGTVVDMGPGGEISGFTIAGGSATYGAGMNVHGSGSQIRDNVFESNAQSAGGYGAAIGGNSSSPTIEQNVFWNNSCDSQFLSGVVAFVNSSSPRIVNNVFLDNPCRAINLTLPATGRPVTINNTIVRNRVGIRVDRRIPTVQQIYRNNIVVENDIGLEVDFGGEANNPTWENNLVFNNTVNFDGIADQTGLSGNLSEDPLFVNSAANDFRLLGGSPAIDAGNPAGAPTVDFEEDLRPVDGNGDGVAEFDIGADEFAFGVTISVIGGTSQECTATGGSDVFLQLNVFPPTLDITGVDWFLDKTLVASGVSPEVFVTLGTHAIDVEASTADSQVLSGSSPVEITDTIKPNLTVAFIDEDTGAEISTAGTERLEKVTVRVAATDTCDEAPTVNATAGLSVSDGDLLKIRKRRNSVEFIANEISLSATAKDESGNLSAAERTLQLFE